MQRSFIVRTVSSRPVTAHLCSSHCSGIQGTPRLCILGCRVGRIWRNKSNLNIFPRKRWSLTCSHQTSTCVTFSDLCPLPKWQRTVRKRPKPPSLVLTSHEHVDYISIKAVLSKKKEKTRRSKGAKKDDLPCKACKAVYGDKSDPKVTEEWISCELQHLVPWD